MDQYADDLAELIEKLNLKDSRSVRIPSFGCRARDGILDSDISREFAA